MGFNESANLELQAPRTWSEFKMMRDTAMDIWDTLKVIEEGVAERIGQASSSELIEQNLSLQEAMEGIALLIQKADGFALGQMQSYVNQISEDNDATAKDT